MTGYLGALSRLQLDNLYARVRAAYEDTRSLAEDRALAAGEQDRDGLRDFQSELLDVAGDAAGEMVAATEREIGAERAAAAERSVRLGQIAWAERLLAAERAS